MRANHLHLCAMLLGLCPIFVHATGIVIPAGGVLDVGDGAMALAGGDVRIDGGLALGGGRLVDVGSFRVGAAGIANLAAGLIELIGDWENDGNVSAGSSHVQLRDGGASSAILGTTTFANLSFLSATGKRYSLQSGLTQSVSGLLDIHGTAALPIQIASTVAGSAAFLNLLPSGTQSIANVGVSDVHATGQHLAPTEHNEGGSGNDSGWFATLYEYVPVPALSLIGLAVLLFGFVGLALRAQRRFTGGFK